jgi:hypothetical protein
MSNTKILEAQRTFAAAMGGDLRAKADLRESLTTSDFPILLGQGFQRKLLTAYQAITPVWQAYSTRTTVPNFKPQRLVEILGGTGGLTRVAEGTEYPARGVSEAQHEFSVGKFGDRIPLTWEMLVNDELGAFRGLDQRLATGARVTESEVTADALLNDGRSDLNTGFFGNVESAALTAESLRDALQSLAGKKDEDGNILVRPSMVLVVAPALEFTARELVTASEVRTTEGKTTTVSANPLAGSVQVVVEPNLLRNSNKNAGTTWLLLPAPNQARPALVTGFLQGQEAPDLRVSNATGARAGGGAINPSEGSFDDDTIQYRVRHVTGAAAIDPTFTFASRGA